MAKKRLSKKVRVSLLWICILIFIGCVISFFLWENDNRLSKSVAIDNFSFCHFEDGGSKITTVTKAMEEQSREIMLCGYLRTDGRPVHLVIYVFHKLGEKPVYMNIGGTKYPPGYFEEKLPENLLSKSGFYYAQIYFERQIVATTKILIAETP